MKIPDYRKQVEQRVTEGAERLQQSRDLLMASKAGRPDALAVSEKSPSRPEVFHLRGEDVQRAQALISDRGTDTKTRIAALLAIRAQVGKSADLIVFVLDRLRDPAEDPALRRAALAVLTGSSFQAAVFRGKRPEYLEILRQLIETPDQELRESVLETLAKEKDEYVQRRLIEGLEDPSKAQITPEKAIQLLGYDSHGEHVRLLESLVENPPSLATKREAVRLLGANAESRALLARLFRDSGEDPEVRATSAVALQALAPEAFEGYAKEVVLDESEDPDLRATCLNALSHYVNYTSGTQDEGFVRAVDGLRSQGLSKELAKAAASYMVGRPEPSSQG